MKNPDLVVQGNVASALDVSVFKKAEDMVSWEFAAYSAYGDEACFRDGIYTLADLFGQNFSDMFYDRRNIINIESMLLGITAKEKELADSKQRVMTWLENPTGNQVEYENLIDWEYVIIAESLVK